MKFFSLHASVVAREKCFPSIIIFLFFSESKPVLTPPRLPVTLYSLWLYKLYFQSVGKSLTFRGTVNEARELMKSHKCSDPVCSHQLWKVSPTSQTNINTQQSQDLPSMPGRWIQLCSMFFFIVIFFEMFLIYHQNIRKITNSPRDLNRWVGLVIAAYYLVLLYLSCHVTIIDCTIVSLMSLYTSYQGQTYQTYQSGLSNTFGGCWCPESCQHSALYCILHYRSNKSWSLPRSECQDWKLNCNLVA